MELQKKDKIQIAVTACLVVVLIVIMAKSFGGMKGGKARKKKASAPAVKAAAVKTPAAKAAPRVSYEKLAEETKRLEFKRDPFFRQVAGATSAVDEPYLSGIVWDSAFPSAIINGKIVGIGEEIVGHIVTDIQKDRVILYNRDTGVEVRLNIE